MSGEQNRVAVRELWSTVTASSVAGFFSRLVCHPVDTLKSRIQAPVEKSAEFNGLRAAFRTTVTEEGVSGLYRGVGAVLLGGVPATSIYLTGYEVSKSLLGRSDFFQHSPFVSYFCSGMIAEALSCIVFVPVDVVKERLQIQRAGIHGSTLPKQLNRTAYRGSFDALLTIFKEEGVSGVYRGYGATLLSFGPFSAFYFLFYEKMKDIVSSEARSGDHTKMSFCSTLACSSLAGAAAAVVSNPLDLIKLRLQISRAGTKETTATVTSVFLGALNSGGILGLFRGASARVAFHVPNVAITMTMFEYVKSLPMFQMDY